MYMIKEELKELVDLLSPTEQMQLWQRFAQFLNDYEIKNCMHEVRKGKKDLFEIHYQQGYIEKYQIYFFQILRNFDGEETEDGSAY